MKGLGQDLDLNLRLLSQVSAQKTFVLGLVVFTKNLRLVLSLAKGLTLRLVGSGLKYGRHKLFSTLNFKWL